ncbi:MAG: MFS transporter [Labedaea sp.]
MERTENGVDRYVTVLRIPSAKALLLANFIGHVPIGMVTVILLLGLGQATGSYATAGLVIGVYVIASGVAAPFWGRCIDRFGAWWVLTGMALAFLLSSAVLTVALATKGSRSLMVAAVIAAGASRPVLAGVVQTLWSRMTPSGTDIQRSAYALHAMQLNFVWILGPLVVTGIVAIFGPVAGPAAAMAVAGAFTCAGALMVAVVWRGRGERPARSLPSVTDGVGGASLYTRTYLGMLASVLLFEAALGSGFVTVGAFAGGAGAASATGLLVAVWFTGSIIGGAWFGMEPGERPLGRQYRWLLLALGGGYLVCAVAGAPWQLGIALFAAGMVLSPTHTVQYSVIASLAPSRSRAEGFTWLSTTSGAGGALGSTLAGPVITAVERPFAGFVLAASCAFAAAGLAALALGGRDPRMAGLRRRRSGR